MPLLLAELDFGSWLPFCLAALLEGETPADPMWEQIVDELSRALLVLVFCGFNSTGMNTVAFMSAKRGLCANSSLDSNQEPFGKKNQVFHQASYRSVLKINLLVKESFACSLLLVCPLTLLVYPLTACHAKEIDKSCIFSVQPCKPFLWEHVPWATACSLKSKDPPFLNICRIKPITIQECQIVGVGVRKEEVDFDWQAP